MSGPFPAFGQTNTFHFRAADWRTHGFEQDAVFYEDAWSADQREHGGNYAGALLTRLNVYRSVNENCIEITMIVSTTVSGRIEHRTSNRIETSGGFTAVSLQMVY